IEIDPGQRIVVLQKGLLHVFLNEQEDALACLSQLINQEDLSDSLYWFAKGVTNDLNGLDQEAIDCLNAGIELNKVNEPLNLDMQKYIDYIVLKSSRDPDVVVTHREKPQSTASPELGNKFLLT